MNIIIYTKPNCAYCDRAKRFLTIKMEPYTEKFFDVGQPKLEGKEYVNVAAFREAHPTAATAPQIFIDDIRIGGYEDLVKHFSSQ